MPERITIDPNICHGKPVIKGTRVLVSNILGYIASGNSIDDLIEDFPNLAKEDVLAAISFDNKVVIFNNKHN